MTTNSKTKRFLPVVVLALTIACLHTASCGKPRTKQVGEMNSSELRTAAIAGNAAAQVAWAGVLENSKPPDLEKAFEWYKAAATNGHTWAIFRVGACYGTGKGVEKDRTEAVKWIRLAADQGEPGAQTMVGQFYLTGQGYTKDLTQAFHWFQEAASAGEPVAQLQLAVCYRTGNGIPADPVVSAEWLHKAADRWNRQAQVHLGICYGTGLGVNRDVVEAYKWETLARDRGYESGGIVCAELEKHFRLTPQQIEDAKQRASEFVRTNRFQPPAKPCPDIVVPGIPSEALMVHAK